MVNIYIYIYIYIYLPFMNQSVGDNWATIQNRIAHILPCEKVSDTTKVVIKQQIFQTGDGTRRRL